MNDVSEAAELLGELQEDDAEAKLLVDVMKLALELWAALRAKAKTDEEAKKQAKHLVVLLARAKLVTKDIDTWPSKGSSSSILQLIADAEVIINTQKDLTIDACRATLTDAMGKMETAMKGFQLEKDFA